MDMSLGMYIGTFLKNYVFLLFKESWIQKEIQCWGAKFIKSRIIT